MKKAIWLFSIAVLVTGADRARAAARTGSGTDQPSRRPNFIVIMTDDQGYQDLGSFGSPQIRTPNLDRMADQGLRFTDFYVGSSVCSASRACLLTGRYSARHGTGGVYFPGNGGLNPEETTLAEALREYGYATAAIGKWHLGDQDVYLPARQGFDLYFGIPYSNDMWIGPDQQFARDAVFREGWDLKRARSDQVQVAQLNGHPDRAAEFRNLGLKEKVPLMEDGQIIEYPADQASLTRRYFDRAIGFIRESGNRPFFVYLTPAMPHVPLFASDDFAGRSARGRYGDAVEEIDAEVGRLLGFLETTGLDSDTLVFFTSDNGPWLDKGDDAGCALPLRDGKFSNYEGGVRVPAIAWWPGHIPPGTVTAALAATIDLLPTFVQLAGSRPSGTGVLDGICLTSLLADPRRGSGHETLFYFDRWTQPVGVRQGKWKYLRSGGRWSPAPDAQPELFNLETDLSESQNLAEDHPGQAAEMDRLLTEFANALQEPGTP